MRTIFKGVMYVLVGFWAFYWLLLIMGLAMIAVVGYASYRAIKWGYGEYKERKALASA